MDRHAAALLPPLRYREMSGEEGSLTTLSDAIEFVRGQAEREAHGPDRNPGQNIRSAAPGESWETVWSALERAQDLGTLDQLAVGRDGLVRKLAAEGLLVFSPQRKTKTRMRMIR